MEKLDFVPIDNWTEYNGAEKSLNSSSVIQLIQDFHGVPSGLLITGIPLHILGIIQQVFIVIYERYEMDPMKRGLTNQVYLSCFISLQFLIEFLTDDIHSYALGLEFIHIHHPSLFHLYFDQWPTLVCFDPNGVPNGYLHYR